VERGAYKSLERRSEGDFGEGETVGARGNGSAGRKQKVAEEFLLKGCSRGKRRGGRPRKRDA